MHFPDGRGEQRCGGRDDPEQPRPMILTSGQGGGMEFPECISVPGKMECPVFSCFTDHAEQISICKVVGWETLQ